MDSQHVKVLVIYILAVVEHTVGMNEVSDRPVVGDVCLRRKRRKRQKKLLKKLYQDYSRNTTLHGLRYTTECGLHIVEKIFWIVTFTASVAMSFYLISRVWNKWTTSPVIVSFAGKPVDVGRIPLPSVTICPAVKFLQSKYNYTQMRLVWESRNKTVDTETLANINAINLLCDSPLIMTHNVTIHSSMINTLINVSTHFDDILYLGQIFENSFRFNPVLTKDGLCFTFNGLRPEDILNMDSIQQDFKYSYATDRVTNWTLDKGYTTDDTNNAYPYCGQDSPGRPAMFILMINLESEKDTLCNSIYSGYKIHLHHPSEWPQAMSYHFVASSEHLTSLAIKVNMVTTSDELQSTALNVRNCYFQHERPLKYYKIYSYNHCRLECLTNYTYAECDCVLFHMPFHDSTKVCSSRQFYCAKSARLRFGNIGSNILEKCKCLPACNFIQYDADFFKTEYKWKDLEDAHKDSLEYGILFRNKSISRVDFTFKEPYIIGVLRSELFGLTDFLGTCGGLLGLFLGFSFLSIVEIFYFLTFRVYKTIQSDLKNETLEKSQQENLKEKMLHYNIAL